MDYNKYYVVGYWFLLEQIKKIDNGVIAFICFFFYFHRKKIWKCGGDSFVWSSDKKYCDLFQLHIMFYFCI